MDTWALGEGWGQGGSRRNGQAAEVEELTMTSVEEVLEKLRAKAQPEQLEGMARYGMTVDKRLGIKIPELRRLAREIGRDHQLALALWETGVAEAMILASMIDTPQEVSEAQIEAWVAGFDSWDVCDQVCMNLFDKTPLAWTKIREWAEREEEFVKRAAFALIACLAWHDKEAGDEAFIELIPVIKAGATDGRNYVKKAVSWALRHVGKRNPALNEAAIRVAEELREVDSPAARWIASDVIRDVTREKVQARLK
jgi:3-methyladenine DNA glycosylase AlkD